MMMTTTSGMNVMNKPKWSDKWRALFDSRRARNAAAGTTSESTMMDQAGASAATTTKNPPQKSLSHRKPLTKMDYGEIE